MVFQWVDANCQACQFEFQTYMDFRLELSVGQDFVMVIMTLLPRLKLPLSDEWYITFSDVTGLNSGSRVTRGCNPSPSWNVLFRTSE
jgi:hypothetical protein